MNILAIDTTGKTASIAIVSRNTPTCAIKVNAEMFINNGLTHSNTLLPMVDSLLPMADIGMGDIDYIALSAGPGSFTGLRIGAALAKGLCFGLGAKIVPVSTLDALAYNVANWGGVIIPIMDARREQVYTALYSSVGGIIKHESDYMACHIDQIISLVKDSKKAAVFLGDGVDIHKEKLMDLGFAIAPGHLALQRAASVGCIALGIADESAIDAAEFEPFYIRPSQAARLAAQKL